MDIEISMGEIPEEFQSMYNESALPRGGRLALSIIP